MFAHFADLQLGFDHGPNGRSAQRREDFFQSWERGCAAVRETAADLTVIAGDVFHGSNPSKAAMFSFLRGLILLTGANCIGEIRHRVIVVSGNHDTPRLSKKSKLEEAVHPLSLFRGIPGVDVVVTDPLFFPGIEVLAIPWQWEEPIDLAVYGFDVARILVVHAPYLGLLPQAAHEGVVRHYQPELAEQFQYVALGDFHNRAQVGQNGWYPGSIERTAFGEIDAQGGGLFVEIDADGLPVVTPWDRPARAMFDVQLDLRGQNDPESKIAAALHQAYPPAKAEKISEAPLLRLTIAGADPTLVDTGSLTARYPFAKLRWVDRPEPPALSSFAPKRVQEAWMEYVKTAEISPEVLHAGSEALDAILHQRNP
jgi:DNA repair exonuclease SbcCD nuclease subunit